MVGIIRVHLRGNLMISDKKQQINFILSYIKCNLLLKFTDAPIRDLQYMPLD